MMMIGIEVDQDNGALVMIEQEDRTPIVDGRMARCFDADASGFLTTLIERDEVVHQFHCPNRGESGLWMTWWCQRSL